MANKTSVSIKWRQLQVLWSKYKTNAVELMVNPAATNEQVLELRRTMIEIYTTLKKAEAQLAEYGLREPHTGNVVRLEPRHEKT
jgi:hypothetical protein